MKVRCIDGSWSSNELTTGKEYEVLSEVGCYYQLKTNDKGIRYQCYVKSRFEVIKEENKMEKTFREVIATIKLGEVWESEEKIIRLMSTNDIVITLKDRDMRINSMGFVSGTLYHLQRKEYTFEEAFKAYEEGKEIESCEGPYRYKKQNGNDAYFDTFAEAWWNGEPITISLQEIRGKWYINN